MIKKLLPTTAVLLVALALGGCAAGSNSPSAQLVQQIESAQTVADHEAIAKYYEAEAAKSRAQSADHLKLVKIYQAVSGRAQHGGNAATGNAPAYHKTLSTQDDANAASFDALAAEHRAMAKTAK
jgi:hypothetical protein